MIDMAEDVMDELVGSGSSNSHKRALSLVFFELVGIVDPNIAVGKAVEELDKVRRIYNQLASDFDIDVYEF